MPRRTQQPPSLDIPSLIANSKTRALGRKALAVDVKANANGRLDYAELTKLDRTAQATAAALMARQPVDVVERGPRRGDGNERPASVRVPAERPGPIKKLGARYDRFIFKDEALLNAKGLPGAAVNWVSAGLGGTNPFWVSNNNRSDPALLRAQARFLELTADTKRLRPTTRDTRRDVLELVKKQLTEDALDARELASFPATQGLAIVKRLALAAKLDLDTVLVKVRDGAVPLPVYERMLGDLSQVPITDYLDLDRPLTDAQREARREQARELDAEFRRQLSYFTENPRATLDDYTRESERLDRRRASDSGFWGKMEAMIRRGDTSDFLPF